MKQKSDDKMLIQVSKSTSKILKNLKISNRESYDEIINRIINNKEADNT